MKGEESASDRVPASAGHRRTAVPHKPHRGMARPHHRTASPRPPSAPAPDSRRQAAGKHAPHPLSAAPAARGGLTTTPAAIGGARAVRAVAGPRLAGGLGRCSVVWVSAMLGVLCQGRRPHVGLVRPALSVAFRVPVGARAGLGRGVGGRHRGRRGRAPARGGEFGAGRRRHAGEGAGRVEAAVRYRGPAWPRTVEPGDARLCLGREVALAPRPFGCGATPGAAACCLWLRLQVKGPGLGR